MDENSDLAKIANVYTKEQSVEFQRNIEVMFKLINMVSDDEIQKINLGTYHLPYSRSIIHMDYKYSFEVL